MEVDDNELTNDGDGEEEDDSDGDFELGEFVIDFFPPDGFPVI